MRLTCRAWRAALDPFITAIQPRRLEGSDISTTVTRFLGLESLSLTALALVSCMKLQPAAGFAIASLTRLQKLSVPDFALHIRCTYQECQPCAAKLAMIRHLTGLRDLNLSSHNHVTEQMFDSLRYLTQLTRLHVPGRDGEDNFHQLLMTRAYSGANMAHIHQLLQALTNLRHLDLSELGERLMSTALVGVGTCTQLTWLNLESNRTIDDSCIAYLGGCLELVHLDISSTQVSGAGLAALSNVTKLQHLDLSGTAVGDEIAMTSFLPQQRFLRSLSLAQCRISDAGLPALSGLTNLRSLSLAYAIEITTAGVLNHVLPLTRHSLSKLRLNGCRLSPEVRKSADCCILSGIPSAFRW
ncbi:hypothetical protein WJX73_001609 [Symbiochloris irregularis]|uniref:Receptor-type protein kinase n=1 Tax=Symbiochloris irregularis TaxID=706552 RepID=A0AAW1NX06_9CHLO